MFDILSGASVLKLCHFRCATVLLVAWKRLLIGKPNMITARKAIQKSIVLYDIIKVIVAYKDVLIFGEYYVHSITFIARSKSIDR